MISGIVIVALAAVLRYLSGTGSGI
jgi:hypothetical protein